MIAFLSELATITDEAVDVDTLMRDPDEDDKAASASAMAAAGEDGSAAEDEPA